MLMITFCAYLFLFEPHMRKIAIGLGFFSVLYLASALFVIQPAARFGLILAHTSDSMTRIYDMLHGGLAISDLMTFAPYFFGIFVSIATILYFLEYESEIGWKKPLGLIVIAPASHWFIVLTQGGGHHYIPIMACTFLAILLFVSNARPRQSLPLTPILLFMTLYIGFVGTLVFVRASRVLTIYTQATTQIASNKETIREITALPPDASVSYWTDRGVDAFVVTRNDVWRFPYCYDSADYLIIQKDARQTFFAFDPISTNSMASAIHAGTDYSTGSTVAIPQACINRVKSALLDEQATHVVQTETEHVLILHRKAKAIMVCPSYTIGMGWLSHIRH